MSKQNHVMVDLETLDIKPTSLILSIGAVAFNPDDEPGTYGAEFYTVVNVQSCKDAGLTTNNSTIDWWMKQDKEAQAVLVEAAKTDVMLSDALVNFSRWWKDNSLKYFWGNGAAFDNVIMTNAYNAVDLGQPWSCWDDRCFRTYKSFFPHIKPNRQGTYHNALDDAKTQVEQMQRMAAE